MWNRTEAGDSSTRFQTFNCSDGWWAFAAHAFERKTAEKKRGCRNV